MTESRSAEDSYRRRDAMDVALIRLYRSTRDPRRLDKLVVRFRPMVRHVAGQYARSSEPMEDLLQVGLLALVKAIERFDIDAGGSFGAYARPTISGEIKRHFRDHTWDVKVPRSVKELYARVARATAERPDASRHELAQLLQISVEEIDAALAAHHAYSADSLDVQPAGSDGMTVGERLGVFDDGYAHFERRDEIEDALSVLGPRDREVVRLRFFDERLQREIGIEHGVSQMQVSRILNRSLEVMGEHLRSGTNVSTIDDDPALPA